MSKISSSSTLAVSKWARAWATERRPRRLDSRSRKVTHSSPFGPVNSMEAVASNSLKRKEILVKPVRLLRLSSDMGRWSLILRQGKAVSTFAPAGIERCSSNGEDGSES